MKLFDLHCDTLYRSTEEDKRLKSNDLYIDIDRGRKYKPWHQCFAIWIPDGITINERQELFERNLTKFNKEIAPCATEEFSPILTVENLSVAGENLEYLSYLKGVSVQMATLTWNCANEVGGGADTDIGITDFGRAAVTKMEDIGMIIDVSHASERLFFDVCDNTKKPFVATHSNAKSVCPNPRNLSDEQIRIIIQRGGIIGLNFHKLFVSDKRNPKFSDILRHAEHILSLGGEHALSIGSDFDGANILNRLKGIESMESLTEYFLKHNLSERLVDDIFFGNAAEFFDTNLQML